MFFDVIVIGAGHAGCEAAAASARMNAKTCLITFNASNIGELSCNPSIGGVGKGILVKEIDALDGIMSKAIDRSGIHYKVLNRSRGPAVWGPRAQADRQLYKVAVQNLLIKQKNLTIIYGEVIDIMIDNCSCVKGIRYKSFSNNSDTKNIYADNIIITTGTFLNGIIHTGSEIIPAGRIKENSSNILANKLKNLGLNIRRLKTGTPPRLLKDSIDYLKLEEQSGDDFPIFFSDDCIEHAVKQIKCYITYTNEKTHDIIRKNIHLSPMYSGQISASGPRYCPSIEDKIMRFADKERHQLFLELEGIDCDTVYPNGISTSLPKNIQEDIVKSIEGLENAKIIQYGYAVEYDYFDAKQLNYTLESKIIKGLFFAGQINGTTGYEEAAAQGIIAGINAALKNKNQEFILTRGDAYIGVMIDDLITKGVTEPYRMMTSRAEFRLSLRYDNAINRLIHKGIEINIVSDERKNSFFNDLNNQQLFLDKAKNLLLSKVDNLIYIEKNDNNKEYKTLHDIIGQIGINFNFKETMTQFNLSYKEVIYLQKEHANRLYQHYTKIQEKDIQLLNNDKFILIPQDLDYTKISSLSNEVRSKIAQYKPKTLLELKNIEGITPAAVIAITIYLKLQKKS